MYVYLIRRCTLINEKVPMQNTKNISNQLTVRFRFMVLKHQQFHQKSINKHLFFLRRKAQRL